MSTNGGVKAECYTQIMTGKIAQSSVCREVPILHVCSLMVFCGYQIGGSMLESYDCQVAKEWG